MTTTHATRSIQIHGPRGVVEHAVATVSRRAHRRRERTIANTVPIGEIIGPRLVCALPDLELPEIIELVVRERLGCLPIVDGQGRPLGMVTKLDIVEQLVVPVAQPRPTAADIMMPLAISLDDDVTVGHAAALMASEDMHHVMIVSDRRLVGVISTMDITRWLADNDGLPD
jgi:CBS domain-containing protein